MPHPQLKNSILQLAVSGRLVNQIASEGNANDLLTQIQKEKQKLIAQVKIKKSKTQSSIYKKEGRWFEKSGKEEKDITDDLPFEIPGNWTWARLGEIGEFTGGKTPSSESLRAEGNIPYYKVSDMNRIENQKFMIKTEAYLDSSYTGKLFKKNTIIFPKNGGAVFTNKKRILTTDSLIDLNTGAFSFSNQLDLEFVYLMFQTIDFRKHYKGTALPTVDTEEVKNILWGIPPLAEQKRIVQKIEELFNTINS